MPYYLFAVKPMAQPRKLLAEFDVCPGLGAGCWRCAPRSLRRPDAREGHVRGDPARGRDLILQVRDPGRWATTESLPNRLVLNMPDARRSDRARRAPAPDGSRAAQLRHRRRAPRGGHHAVRLPAADARAVPLEPRARARRDAAARRDRHLDRRTRDAVVRASRRTTTSPAGRGRRAGIEPFDAEAVNARRAAWPCPRRRPRRPGAARVLPSPNYTIERHATGWKLPPAASWRGLPAPLAALAGKDAGRSCCVARRSPAGPGSSETLALRPQTRARCARWSRPTAWTATSTPRCRAGSPSRRDDGPARARRAPRRRAPRPRLARAMRLALTAGAPNPRPRRPRPARRT